MNCIGTEVEFKYQTRKNNPVINVPVDTLKFLLDKLFIVRTNKKSATAISNP